VPAVLLGRPDGNQDRVDPTVDRGLDLGPGEPLDEAFGDRASLTSIDRVCNWMSDI
jgi:hypothetical protein